MKFQYILCLNRVIRIDALFHDNRNNVFYYNKEIYKIGRSSNIENRVRNYPNGSKILLAIISRNSIQCEKDLIKKFTPLKI